MVRCSIRRGGAKMKITHVTTRVLRTPADNPLVVGLPAPTDTREFVTLELGTDEGLTGVGVTFFGGALTPALKAAVDALATLMVGDDPSQTEAIAAKARRAAGGSGPGGIFTLALSAIDIACWDLKGKAAGRSVAALLGGSRDRVSTYASGALMRPHPIDYLAKAGPRLRDMGFRQMKMQCGSEPTIGISLERVRVMREALGPDIDLMCDINRRWSGTRSRSAPHQPITGGVSLAGAGDRGARDVDGPPGYDRQRRAAGHDC